MKKVHVAALAFLCAWLATGQIHPAHAVEAGQAAPAIQLKDLRGQEVSLASLKGKVVMVDFWASWCGPCRESMPFLEKLSKTYKDKGLIVLGVNIDNEVKAAHKFLSEIPVSFAVVNDSEKKVAKAYAPPTMPSSYLIDRQGRIRHVHAGFKSSDAKGIEAEVKTLLQ